MEHMLPQPERVASPPLPAAAFYALHGSPIAVISDIKANQYLPTRTPHEYWKAVLLH